MKRIKILLNVLLFHFVAIAQVPTNYYVSVNGNDSNDGLSQETPLRTPQTVVNMVLPGDTVNFMDGTYECNSVRFLYITTSGKENLWITYRALKGHHPVIKSFGNVWETVLIEADYIVFEGFDMCGDAQNIELSDAEAAEAEAEAGGTDWDKYSKFNNGAITLGGNNSTGNHHSIVRNCVIHDFPGGGIQSIKMDYVTVENNTVYNNCWYMMYAGSGISLWHLWNSDTETGYKNFVHKNICHDNKTLVKWVSLKRYSDGNGIIIDDNKNEQEGAIPGVYKGKTLVENNISFNNGGSGIHAYNCENVDIVNNTAYNNGVVPQVAYPEIFQGSCSNGKVMNNIMYARQGGRVNSDNNNLNVEYDYNIYFNAKPEKKGNHDIEINPKFVKVSADPLLADFNLIPASPAIDYGNKNFYASEDINGVKRPSGNGPDCGAYESGFIQKSLDDNQK